MGHPMRICSPGTYKAITFRIELEYSKEYMASHHETSHHKADQHQHHLHHHDHEWSDPSSKRAEANLHRSDAAIEKELVADLLSTFDLTVLSPDSTGSLVLKDSGADISVDGSDANSTETDELTPPAPLPRPEGVICLPTEVNCRLEWCKTKLKLEKSKLPPLVNLGFPLAPPIGKLGR
eukprot:726949-Prorocentrum_minimum.AAC.2